jgi:hypothetical protein
MAKLSGEAVQRARAYNRRKGQGDVFTVRAWAGGYSGPADERLVYDTAQYQQSKRLKVDGAFGPTTKRHVQADVKARRCHENNRCVHLAANLGITPRTARMAEQDPLDRGGHDRGTRGPSPRKPGHRVGRGTPYREPAPRVPTPQKKKITTTQWFMIGGAALAVTMGLYFVMRPPTKSVAPPALPV